MKNVMYDKVMENVRNRIDARFGVGMCTLDLSKVLMYEFH